MPGPWMRDRGGWIELAQAGIQGDGGRQRKIEMNFRRRGRAVRLAVTSIAGTVDERNRLAQSAGINRLVVGCGVDSNDIRTCLHGSCGQSDKEKRGLPVGAMQSSCHPSKLSAKISSVTGGKDHRHGAIHTQPGDSVGGAGKVRRRSH